MRCVLLGVGAVGGTVAAALALAGSRWSASPAAACSTRSGPGDIALRGRLHAVPTPASAFFVDLAGRLVRDGARPGALTADDLAAGL